MLVVSIFAVDAKPANAQAAQAVESVKEFFFGKSVAKSVAVAEVATTTLVDDKSNCEVFDGITDNVLDLESSSSEMKLKIDKIEDIVDQEFTLRAEIYGNTKDLILLKSKEKIIFKTMKKQIEDAYTYYSSIDSKIVESSFFVDTNICDDESLQRDDVLKVNDDIIILKTGEAIFRKELVASLKDKVKTLQENVKGLKAQNK